MNIGILTPGFSANSDDWALPFLQNLVDELSTEEDVRVIALRYPHQTQPYAINQVRVYPLGYGSDTRGLRRLQLWTATLRKIIGLHREKPFHVLHAIWADETGLLATWAGRLLNIPTVTSIAGGELVCFPEIGYGSQCSCFGRWIVGQALKAKVVTVSGSHSRGLIQKAGYDLANDTIHTVIWGVDTEKFTPEPSQKQEIRLLHVGSLVGIKNQAMLLRAVARLENVELDIVGDGVLRPKLEKLARELDIAQRVHFHGSIPYPDMPQYYQRATLHIITSHNEFVPMATLEAAACAVPTISTKVGIVVDYPEMGLTVDNDEVALAEAINDLLRDNERRVALSQSAYETVQELFTLADTTENLLTTYLHLYS
ncbi:MAG: glycosyltransferase [Anaerolineae bacterium]|nr:glycosyltransferase [Anaerolineae bacterium]